jgi:hypothetical protein
MTERLQIFLEKIMFYFQERRRARLLLAAFRNGVL